ncbi:MAG: translesion error-prone DNA polymerase V autoproteolytic subunit [Candidatus Cloacimonetes bacterium]|nr:translesion error-prone DNA polymerase V autoproteolytic subunit [Candidatus Cloacimonadota bacterium]MDD2650835.1 translesion error-prone DNA polymerase V autoproteolytic subunit [Candidatus Cloacimonadota bacterium]
MIFSKLNEWQRPFIGSLVPAGFPSPAQDYIESVLDLNELLIQHPAATYFVRVEGYSMINSGINPNDILIVDRSLEAADGKVVIAVLEGEFTVKRLQINKKGEYYLMPDNDAYKPIKITNEMDFSIWGVVTNVIHKL